MDSVDQEGTGVLRSPVRAIRPQEAEVSALQDGALGVWRVEGPQGEPGALSGSSVAIGDVLRTLDSSLQHLHRTPALGQSTSWTQKSPGLAESALLPTPCRAGANLGVSIWPVLSQEDPAPSGTQ